jgi:hypothetical protein
MKATVWARTTHQLPIRATKARKAREYADRTRQGHTAPAGILRGVQRPPGRKSHQLDSGRRPRGAPRGPQNPPRTSHQIPTIGDLS